jgi:23S rRNA (uracil1939-C5)-methyltransferase
VVEARAEEILESDIQRVPAACPHFGVCGGCDWQDVPYTDQLALKQAFVCQRLGAPGLKCPQPSAILGAAEPTCYRNRMDFAFGDGREARLMLGLHVSPDKLAACVSPPPVSITRGSTAPVFDVTDCRLQSEQSNAILREAREALSGGRYRAYDPESRSGWLRSLVVRESNATREAVVELTTARSGPGAALAEKLMHATLKVNGVVESVSRKRSRHAAPTSRVVVAGEGRLTERLLDLDILVSSPSFTQVNVRQAERLYETVLAFAELSAADRVLDLYCGAGSLSLLLARSAAHVTGVELVDEAVADALENARLNGAGNCTFVCGDVVEVLPEFVAHEGRFSVVCVNPPRSGVDRTVIKQILKGGPDRIVYVSCNPVTLARDLRGFVKGGYEIVAAQPVDMFPQTHHVEVVVKMTR